MDKANGPAYLQLYHQLRDDIINGAFGYNSKLPSKRVLSENAGVSVITVEHAYALLCDEGYPNLSNRLKLQLENQKKGIGRRPENLCR